MLSSSKRAALDKFSEKQQGKEWKASTKHTSPSSSGGYNPESGTFHVFAHDSKKTRSVNDDDQIAAEYDSASNNGSCSGESVSPEEEKHGVPGLGTKRDKIRLKNERKHQRQKERRAEELKDRCTGYLMSRKLENLTQQLVTMGFASDCATMALILNEGNIEKSISFLLEATGEQLESSMPDRNIDISEELARIAEVERRCKYPRTDIERAIIACQGDLDKALEWLSQHHQHQPNAEVHQPAMKQDERSNVSASVTQQTNRTEANGLHQSQKHRREERGPGSLKKNGRTQVQPPGTRKEVSPGTLPQPSPSQPMESQPTARVPHSAGVESWPVGPLQHFHESSPPFAQQAHSLSIDPAALNWNGGSMSNVPPAVVQSSKGSTGSSSGNVLANPVAARNSVQPVSCWNCRDFDYRNIDENLSNSLASGLKVPSDDSVNTYDLLGGSRYGERHASLENARNDSDLSGVGGCQEWTSPFAGKDLFASYHQPIPL